MRLSLLLLSLLLTTTCLAGGGGSLIDSAQGVVTVTQQPQTLHSEKAEMPLTSHKSSPQAPSLQEPVLYSASYNASYNGFPIDTKRELSRTANGYRLTQTASNFLGKIDEEETFALDADQQFHPRNYRYSKSIFGKSSEETMIMDINSGEIVSTRKGETTRLADTHDWLGPLSYQQQIQRDLGAGITTLDYQVVIRGKVKNYRYQVAAKETIDTPLGRLDTLKLERLRDNNDRETYLWVAVELNYLPVKLVQKEEDGESYEMVIKAYTEKAANP